MAYHLKAPEKASTLHTACLETCSDLKETIGQSNMLEIEAYRAQLSEQRANIVDGLGPREAVRALPELKAFDGEIACINKWINQCELEIPECKDDCRSLKDKYQGPLSSDAVSVLMAKNLDVVEDKTQPRNLVVEAKKEINCLDKYEVCIGSKTKLEHYR